MWFARSAINLREFFYAFGNMNSSGIILLINSSHVIAAISLIER